jgi:curved DNA-binding protein CbpA
MSAPQAKLTGSLAQTPVPELLVYALDHNLNGTLVIEEPSGAKSAVLLEAGAPSKAKTAEPVVTLAQVLVEQGVIDEVAARAALTKMGEQNKLFGEILLAEKKIPYGRLQEALREQVVQKVIWLFARSPECVFGYYEGSDFLANWGGVPTRVKPLPLMWRGLRQYVDEARVDALMARLGNTPLKLYFDAPVGRFKLDPHERGVVDMLRAKPMALGVLLGCGLGDPKRVRRVVYGLALTRQLDLGSGKPPIGIEEAPSAVGLSGLQPLETRPPKAPSDGPAAPGAGGARQTSPPTTLPDSVAVRARKQEIRERADRQGESYYEVLGVAHTAPTSEIQTAFFQLAKTWHPDRLGAEFAEVRAEATRSFARMSEAHQVLGDEDQRRQYDELVQKGGGSADEQEQVAQVIRAATAFQRAEVHLKKRNLDAAEQEAKAAVDGDPGQADYQALYAWVQAQRPHDDYTQLIQRLSEALKAEPENRKALWYRGQLFKRAGDPKRAVRDFRSLLELDPRHLEAQREVRLYEMRKSAPKGEKGGILGKWFKRR